MITVADIAKKAFDGVAAKVGGVIHACTLRRDRSTGYNVSTGAPNVITDSEACRMVFSRADAGQKYFPELVISAPDDVAFIAGAQALAPKSNDTLTLASGAQFRIVQSRDILQAAGLWAAVVRPC